MRTIYVPALLTGIENVVRRCIIPGNKFGLYKDKYDVSWFTEKAIFTHPHLLISYYYSGRFDNYKKELRIKDNITLWADSGGYSIATQGAKIDPHKVLKWQEQNSDIAFTLDYPPVKVTAVGRVSPGKNERITPEEFEQSAEKTRRNNLIFYNNRTNDKLKIYNIIHGYDIKSYDLWWDYTAKDMNFDGYGTGMKPTSDCLLQALSIMYLWNKGVRKRIHLLGVSGIIVIPVLVWASQYIDKISFDSTSYGYGSRTRAYVYPDRIRYYTHFGKKYITKNKPIEKITCNCPICKDFDDPSYFIGGGTTMPGMLLSLHNLWAVKQYVELLDHAINIEKDKNKFFQLIKQHTGNRAHEAMHAINFIEDVIKNGLQKTYDIYFSTHNFDKQKFKPKILI